MLVCVREGGDMRLDLGKVVLKRLLASERL